MPPCHDHRHASPRHRARRAGPGSPRPRPGARRRLRDGRGRGSRREGAVLPEARWAAGQARLLLALLAPGAGRAAVDRAAVPVSRHRRADHLLLDPRGDGLQRALRKDAVLSLLAWVTRGWLTTIPDKVKEGVVFAALLV